MTESLDGDARSTSVSALTAGGMLREARQAKGLHIAALAASIKVAQRKLELLEADRFDELPDATFTRALAHTLCRSLKIDPVPVLALLPTIAAQKLPQAGPGLNAPFRDDEEIGGPEDLQFLKSPVVLAAAGLLIAGALVYLMPAAWLKDHGLSLERGESSVVQGPDAASAPVFVPAPVVEAPTVPTASEPASTGDIGASAPPSAASEATQPSAPSASPVADLAAAAAVPTPVLAAPVAAPQPAPAASALQLRATGDSWVEVIDARGSSLLSRQLQSGETVDIDGRLPLRVKIGNASATQVVFKGNPVELTPTRDNVAKLVLK